MEALEVEIRVREAVVRYEVEDLRDMAEARLRHRESKTLRGRFFSLLGYLMIGYCVYRVIMAVVNIVFARDPTKDPITRGFEILLTFFRIPDAEFFVQPVSFVVIGILVFTSIRSFLLFFARLFHRVSTSVTSSRVALLFAIVTGTYFVSTVLLLRMSMPEQYRRAVTQAVGDIAFNFFHRWFDVIFVLSAVASAVSITLSIQQRTLIPGSAATASAALKAGGLDKKFDGDAGARSASGGERRGGAGGAGGAGEREDLRLRQQLLQRPAGRGEVGKRRM